MVVGFDVITIIDLVGRIGRVVANFHGQDDYVHLDAYLAQMLPNDDTGLRRSLTLAVLAGAQEAARFGVMMIVSVAGQLPAMPVLDFARNKVRRLSFAFGAFVNPPIGGVDGRNTSLPDAAVDDVAMNLQLSVVDVPGTAQRLGFTYSIRPPDTDVLDQRVAQPGVSIAKLRKTTVRAASRRVETCESTNTGRYAPRRG